MSTEYDSVLVVGWLLDKNDLPKKFIKNLPETSHMEDRFDPKTGQKVVSEVVIDSEEREIFVLDGIEYEDEVEFFYTLAHKVGAVASQVSIYPDGMRYALEPKIARRSRANWCLLGLYDMAKYAKSAKAIHNKLIKLGFKLPKPKVMAVLQRS
jgi:hypothetical protein